MDEAAGQPTPGPRMFWSVTIEVCKRASWEAWSFPSGKVTGTEGLFTTRPAFTFLFSSYGFVFTSVMTSRQKIKKRLTAINWPRSGGQKQGILTTWPAALVIPSQSPVPVGLTPASTPNWGMRSALTSRLMRGKFGAESIGTPTARRTKADDKNFIVEVVKNVSLVENNKRQRQRNAGKECYDWRRKKGSN